MHTQPAAGSLSEAEEIVTELGEHLGHLGHLGHLEHLGSGPPTYEEAMWPHV